MSEQIRVLYGPRGTPVGAVEVPIAGAGSPFSGVCTDEPRDIPRDGAGEKENGTGSQS